MLNDVAALVAAYVRRTRIDDDQLLALIAAVGQSTASLGHSDVELEQLTPVVPARRRIAPDALTCLECGATAKTMKRHLRIAHSLTPEACRTKWQLPRHHPMTAPEYSKQRRALATAMGLGGRTRQPRR